jgi:DnaJ-class molecular chaperone with C-terminal Zn finger domain
MSSHPTDDPYTVLGVPRTATARDISHAYRALLRAHHPDTRDQITGPTADAGTELQRILTAYAILRDPARRAEYDRLRKPARHARPRTEDPPIRAGSVHWKPAKR